MLCPASSASSGKRDKCLVTLLESNQVPPLPTSCFLNAVGGNDDGLGDPKKALLDVQIIESALMSEGKAIKVGFD